MKKIFAILGAAIAIATVSCTKAQVEEPILKDNTIKLNLSLPGADGAMGTKAAKKAWVSGDKLNIWFNVNKDDLNHAAPDLVITYNGTKWVAGTLRSGATMSASGDKMLFMYEGTNNLSGYTFEYNSSKAWYHKNAYGDSSNECYSSPMVFYAVADYTYADDTLTATVSSWTYLTQFKVLVKNDNGGMTNTADHYRLQVKNVTDDQYPTTMGAFNCNYVAMLSKLLIERGSANDTGWAGGVQEADGIAFYYNQFLANDKDITFTLLDFDSSVSKTYTVTGKTISATFTNRCVGVALNYSSFAAAAPAHAYVDLGLTSGIKWATCNIGAANPGDYGDYYDWGAIDAAITPWGDGWTVPTKDNWDELLAQCTWEWDIMDGHYGARVSKNGKSIFLPAAGDATEYFSKGVNGCYWSWTLDDPPYEDTFAYYCYFSYDGDMDFWNYGTTTDYKTRQYSVRPVKN